MRTEKIYRGEVTSTPSRLGYHMPAEWEPHEATWLAWPHNEETWPGKLAQIEEVYLQMIEALAVDEKIHLLVDNEKERERVEKLSRGRGIPSGRIRYFLVPTVDAWVRDYGPNFIQRDLAGKREVAWVKWKFNAWGEKYESLMADDRVGEELASKLGLTVFRTNLVLEGGSIEPNGLGVCLVTEQCLLNSNRNPGFSRSQIEETLKDFLGFTHFIWLGDGLEGDDTDGHIDDIARFVGPRTVAAADEKNSSDANEKSLRENLRRLGEARDQKGKPLEIIPLPLPGRVEASWGRLPASYLNFYIGNGAVLVPTFGDRNDSIALGKLQELFRDRRIVGIRCEDLVLGMGALHCITHEQPAGDGP